MRSLLAVDLGLKTGLALYGGDGRLVWYRSTNFGSMARLKRGAFSVLNGIPDLTWMVLEGGGEIAEVWEKEAERRRVAVRRIAAHHWRERLLYVREQRTGKLAKRNAGEIARRVIDWSGAARPTSLRHDAAEAILIGLWGVLYVEWLDALPAEVRR